MYGHWSTLDLQKGEQTSSRPGHGVEFGTDRGPVHVVSTGDLLLGTIPTTASNIKARVSL